MATCRRLPIQLACALCVVAVAPLAHAQFFDRLSNPAVTVDLQHPPSLGLQVERLAFGPASGKCSDEIIQAMIDDFVSSGLEVIDRQNLDLILAEHDFTFSGYVDEASAAAMGRILGPSAMVIVDVQRCAFDKKRLRDTVTRYDSETEQDYEQPVYKSRTRAFVKASVRTVDLTTGRIFAARTLDYAPERQAESYEGYPEYPSELAVLDTAFGWIVRDAHRMFLPWTERTSLIYFDDKACGLKAAYQALRSGMADRAHDLSLANLEACKTAPKAKKKTLAHAYYNVGMSHMMRGEYDAALEYFFEAAKLRPGDIVSKAIADTRKAKDLLASMQRIEESTALALQEREVQAQNAARTEQADTLTNADIVTMARQRLPEAIILKKIETSTCSFDTSGDALVELTQAGVGENVIIAMMDAE